MAPAVPSRVVIRHDGEAIEVRDGAVSVQALPLVDELDRVPSPPAPAASPPDASALAASFAPSLAALVCAATAGLAPWLPSVVPSLSLAAPPLAAGDQVREYIVTEAIVQGWLYKKGTGGDWAGRRWWKPRWVTLALAENASTDGPTPMLFSHRAPGVPYPASVVELTESTVIMAVERAAKGVEADGAAAPAAEWNRHCFQVVPTGRRHGAGTRLFAAPAAERNDWAFAINRALLGHARRRGQARAARRAPAMRPRRHVEEAEEAGARRGLPRSRNRSGRRVASPSPARRAAVWRRPPVSPRRSRSVGPPSTANITP